MAQAEQIRTLSKFNITETDDAYAIHIEDDAGEMIEFQATPEQIDLIADVLDELLYADDALEVDEEEAEDEED
jgi:hypothetical protein